MIRLRFEGGTIIIDGEVGTPYGRWDPRIRTYRAKAINYHDILLYLEESGLEYLDNVPRYPPKQTARCDFKLRPYQEEALEAWLKAGGRGIIVLPTAAGKTYIALKAISQLSTSTLIVVPTLDLLDQWRNRVEELLHIEAGVVGGGERKISHVTVSTYDSAYLQAESLGNRFKEHRRLQKVHCDYWVGQSCKGGSSSEKQSSEGCLKLGGEA